MAPTTSILQSFESILAESFLGCCGFGLLQIWLPSHTEIMLAEGKNRACRVEESSPKLLCALELSTTRLNIMPVADLTLWFGNQNCFLGKKHMAVEKKKVENVILLFNFIINKLYLLNLYIYIYIYTVLSTR